MNKILKWIKSQRWIVTAGMVLGAIALALSAAKSSKRKSSATRKEKKAVDLMNRAVGSDLKRAEKLTKSAAKDKQKAINSRETVKYELEKLTQTNDDLDSVVDAFNSRTRRVRQSGKTQST